MRLIVAITLGVLLGTACDVGPTEQAEIPNVTVHVGAELITTDTAVLVNGERLIDFGHGPRGVYANSFTEFTYGGLHERVNDALVDESWYMTVGRMIVRDVQRDTMFLRSLDLGDVALGGTPADRHDIDTLIVLDSRHPVRVYEKIISNWISIYNHRLNMDGSTVTFSHEPYYERMLAGAALELTASGSADIAPTSAPITLRPGVQITALWNGEDLSFERELQVFRADQPLVVQLSRSLDPERTVLHLEWAPPSSYVVDPDVRRRASAVFQLQERTDRLVIPASALAEVVSHLPVEVGGFVFRIYEYHVVQDVLEIERLKEGITESLRAVQSNGFGLYVRMGR